MHNCIYNNSTQLFSKERTLLFLDEPAANLDLEGIRLMTYIPSVEALEQMFAEYEGTLLFVSHDQAFIRASSYRGMGTAGGKAGRKG